MAAGVTLALIAQLCSDPSGTREHPSAAIVRIDAAEREAAIDSVCAPTLVICTVCRADRTRSL
ncbi:MAG: hypothetical protein WCD11_15945 [Solirubrobacteraceae bacterium]